MKQPVKASTELLARRRGSAGSEWWWRWRRGRGGRATATATAARPAHKHVWTVQLGQTCSQTGEGAVREAGRDAARNHQPADRAVRQPSGVRVLAQGGPGRQLATVRTAGPIHGGAPVLAPAWVTRPALPTCSSVQSMVSQRMGAWKTSPHWCDARAVPATADPWLVGPFLGARQPPLSPTHRAETEKTYFSIRRTMSSTFLEPSCLTWNRGKLLAVARPSCAVSAASMAQ